MRLASRGETEDVINQLSEFLDSEIPDPDHAVATLDRYVEWVASYPDDMKVQKAYGAGDPVGEWGGLPAAETLAVVTPASVLNSLFCSVFEAAALVFTPDGIAVVLRDPGDPTS